jgi:hypothetical protein
MTRTETTTKANRAQTEARARCNRSTDCRCGQGLDVSVRAHCPRCGRSLVRP